MSGECRSYRLNEPMKWKEFKAMPDDIKVTYINVLRQKYAVPNRYLAEMFGCSAMSVSSEFKRLGLIIGRGKHDRVNFDRDGFFGWLAGVTVEKAEEEACEEPVAEIVEEVTIAEDDLPWNKPEVEESEPAPEPVHHTYVSLDSMKAIPQTGSLTFTGNATQIMNTLVNLLGNAKVLLSVNWDVVEG